jgi:hypothetical protein
VTCARGGVPLSTRRGIDLRTGNRLHYGLEDRPWLRLAGGRLTARGWRSNRREAVRFEVADLEVTGARVNADPGADDPGDLIGANLDSRARLFSAERACPGPVPSLLRRSQ